MGKEQEPIRNESNKDVKVAEYPMLCISKEYKITMKNGGTHPLFQLTKILKHNSKLT